MSAESPAEARAALRAYEMGRLRSSTWRALVVVFVIAMFGLATTGRPMLGALPITLVAWILAFWRGDILLRGAVFGSAGGFVTALLPMSVLRPCCGMPGMDCCTMPSACLGASALVGLVLATAVPYGKTTWWRTAVGLALGMTSVVVLRCTTLAIGETLGLLGGLLCGVTAAATARRLLRPA